MFVLMSLAVSVKEANAKTFITESIIVSKLHPDSVGEINVGRCRPHRGFYFARAAMHWLNHLTRSQAATAVAS